MTATKMNAQEIIQFIANAEKKTSVKVTFEGELATAVPSSVVKLGSLLRSTSSIHLESLV